MAHGWIVILKKDFGNLRNIKQREFVEMCYRQYTPAYPKRVMPLQRRRGGDPASSHKQDLVILKKNYGIVRNARKGKLNMKFKLKDSLYETLIVCARDCKSVKTNLKKGDLTVDKTKRFVIDHKQIYGVSGINSSDLKEIGIENCIEDPWHVLEILYERYKHSVTKKDIKRSYFKALDKDELTDADIINGEDRYIARSMLEGYVILASANGILQWPDDDLWFWQSETDPDLIVLKEWIKQEDK